MRVYTVDEAMDVFRAGDGLPSRRESTTVWQKFLARMREAPQTPATQAAIRVAQRELLWRQEGSIADRQAPAADTVDTSPALNACDILTRLVNKFSTLGP